MFLPLNIHVSVAASGVAVLSPTPTPFNTARVANMVVIEEQNACREREMLHISHREPSLSLPPEVCPITGSAGSRY